MRSLSSIIVGTGALACVACSSDSSDDKKTAAAPAGPAVETSGETGDEDPNVIVPISMSLVAKAVAPDFPPSLKGKGKASAPAGAKESKLACVVRAGSTPADSLWDCKEGAKELDPIPEDAAYLACDAQLAKLPKVPPPADCSL